MNIASLLEKALRLNQINLPQTTQNLLLDYLALIQKWNQVFNLTNITKPFEMVYLHLIDSLIIHPFLNGERLLDVGSGAGLPGLPLAMLDPKRHWTLLDKTSKKTRFLNQVVAELNLRNVEVVQERVENFHPAQGFDTILSRAFGSIQDFVSKTEHLLNTKGIFLAMKGVDPQDELSVLDDYFIASVKKLDIKGMSIQRHIVMIYKNRHFQKEV